MKLMPGRTVVHPHHGPATITRRFTRKLKGETVDYIEMNVKSSMMDVAFPVDKADYIGIRDLAGLAEMKELAEVLAAPSGKQEKQWSRRIKAEQEHVNSGDPLRIAMVLRDLVRRDEKDGLGTSEKQLMRDASEPLTCEIAISLGRPEEEILEVLRTVALEQDTSVLKNLTGPLAKKEAAAKKAAEAEKATEKAPAKTTARKTTARKTTARKTTTRKTTARKTTARKTTTKATAAKKAA